MPFALPYPYTPGLPGSGLGNPEQYADAIQANLDAIAVAIGNTPVLGSGGVLELASTGTRRRIAYGNSPGFTWSGGIHTLVTVTHGLGTTPVVVIPSSARYADAIGDDARSPWLTTTNNFTSTTFDLLFNTKNNAVIGAFSVPAGACQWIAIG